MRCEDVGITEARLEHEVAIAKERLTIHGKHSRIQDRVIVALAMQRDELRAQERKRAEINDRRVR